MHYKSGFPRSGFSDLGSIYSNPVIFCNSYTNLVMGIWGLTYDKLNRFP
jgi:hypothetical protein